MKLSSLLPRNVNRQQLVWLSAVLFLIVITLFFLNLSTGVSSYTPVEPPEAALSPVTASEVLDPGSGVGAWTTTPSWPTYTLILPVVRQGYWEAPDSLLGVQLHLSYPPQEAASKAAQAGTRWARLALPWAWIEPSNTTPEHYQWPSSLGDRLARLSAKKIQVIVTLCENPSWAATYRGGPIDRADISELVEFMTAAVNHYGAPPYNVKHWEFYNEPDNSSLFYAENGWGYWGNEADEYAAMLAAVYQPMKAADPEAQIVFGGVAYDWWTSQGGPFVKEFVDIVLQRGGGRFFDVMNFHYYPAFRSNWEPYGADIIGKATYLRNKLASYGVNKPLICTEASMWSDEVHGGSHELQSRYVAQLFARSMATNLQTTIWHMLVDNPELGTWKYGLLNPDLSPKPAYFAYQTFARQLAFADYVRTLSSAETGSEQIEAYEFAKPKDPTRIIVAWTEDEQERRMRLAAAQVVVVDKFGNQTTIYDGDDGAIDGRVWATVGPSPVYLRVPH